MSDVRKNAEALRDECERWARSAERDMFNPDLSVNQRQEASDKAKVYWQMSRNWADTVANSADARPRKFTGKRKLCLEVEDARFAVLQRIYEANDKIGRQELAHKAWKENEAKSIFPSEDRIYKSLTPKMFDRIRKQS